MFLDSIANADHSTKVHHIGARGRADVRLIVAGATTATVAGTRFGRDPLPNLKPSFHTDAAGHIGSAGLELWPPSLTNLHHWLWGESTFGVGSPVRLPSPSWPYATHEGLAA